MDAKYFPTVTLFPKRFKVKGKKIICQRVVTGNFNNVFTNASAQQLVHNSLTRNILPLSRYSLHISTSKSRKIFKVTALKTSRMRAFCGC